MDNFTNLGDSPSCYFGESGDTLTVVAGFGGVVAAFVIFIALGCICTCCKRQQIWTTVVAADQSVETGNGVLVAPPVSDYERHETAVFYFCCAQERVQFYCPMLRLVTDGVQVWYRWMMMMMTMMMMMMMMMLMMMMVVVICSERL